MRCLCPLGVGLVLAGAVPAQASLFADTNVGVFARAGSTLDVQLIRAGTQFSGPLAARASVAGATAGVTAAPRPSLPGNAAFRISEDADASTVGPAGPTVAGTTPADPSSFAQPGPHAFLLRGSAILPVLVLRLNLTGSAAAGARAHVTVDVGNDGSIEWTAPVDGQPHTAVLPFTGAFAPVARITFEGLATPPAGVLRSSYRADLDLDLGPPNERPCQFTVYGPACGMAYRGDDQVQVLTHTITLAGTGAFPSSPVVLIFGDRPLAFPLPGSSCTLLTNPLASVSLRSDIAGDFHTTIVTRGPLSGVAYSQAFSVSLLQPNHLRGSQGLEIDCGM